MELNLSEHILRELYINQNLTIKQLCAKLDICECTAIKYLKKYNIKKSKELKKAAKERNYMEKYGYKDPMLNPEVIDKYKKTCIAKYGCDNPLKNDLVRSKCANTNLKKFGCENVFSNEHIKEKIKNTNITKYGVDNVQKLQEFRDKSRDTSRIKYGTDKPSQSDIVKEKIRKTNMNKYGVEQVFNAKEVKDKIKQTNLERYGSEYFLGSAERKRQQIENNWTVGEEVKDKIKQTNLEKYGVPYYTQTPEMVEKSKCTMKNKYGKEHALQVPEILEKQQNTMLERYGYKSAFNTPDFYNTLRKERMLEKYGVSNNSQIHLSNYSLEILHSKDKFLEYLQKFDYMPTILEVSTNLGCSKSTIYRVVKDFNASEYINFKYSSGEQDLYNLYPTHYRNYRNLIYLELDLWYPDKNIAIEYNGDYWHSTKRKKSTQYHRNKVLRCLGKGVRLIHVYEHEWNNVKLMGIIKEILGIAMSDKITYSIDELELIKIPVADAETIESERNINPMYGIHKAILIKHGHESLALVTLGADKFINVTLFRNVALNFMDLILDMFCMEYVFIKVSLDKDDLQNYMTSGFSEHENIDPEKVVVDRYGNIVYNEDKDTYTVYNSGYKVLKYENRRFKK